jgi:hypothetical protein
VTATTPQVGAWQQLDGGHGATLGVAGDHTVSAQLGYISMWTGSQLVASADAPAPTPGRPRIVAGPTAASGAGAAPTDGGAPDPFSGERVLWGAAVLDLATGRLESLAGLRAAVVGTSAPPARPGFAPPGSQVSCYAWSPDGSVVLVARQETGPPQAVTASAALHHPGGEVLAELWHGNDLSPVAAWVGPSLAALGTRQSQVLGHDGSHRAELDGTTPPVRIEASGDERRLLVVENHRLRLWDTVSWSPVGTAAGQWLDAALTPDGALVVAVDFAGTLHALDQTLSPSTPLPAPGRVDGVAVTDDRIAVAIPGAVCTAPLSR